MWVIYALLAALFAALTSIFAKIGIVNVNSDVATAIRTTVALLMAFFVVFITGKQNEIANIGQKSWIFLILSGCATGVSWLFFYKALQIGDVSKVVPVDKLSVVITMLLAYAILGEAANAKSIVGGLLITAGALLIIS